jgi:hypothetical protein
MKQDERTESAIAVAWAIFDFFQVVGVAAEDARPRQTPVQVRVTTRAAERTSAR